jgi:hypothetical protein
MKTMATVFAAVSCAALIAAGLVPEARADAWNKKTIITINEPMQVPKKVLAPGKYVFKLADSQSDRHIVQIFSENEKQLVATILAIPNYRLKVRGKSEFGFWETPAGQPRALRAWFYPGDNFGHEFAYPPSMSTEITTYSKQTPPTTYSNTDEDLATAKVEPNRLETDTYAVAETTKTTDPAPVPAPVAEAPAPQPAVREQADRPSAQAQPSTSLPQTASNYPLIALIGFLSLGAFTAMAARSRA